MVPIMSRINVLEVEYGYCTRNSLCKFRSQSEPDGIFRALNEVTTYKGVSYSCGKQVGDDAQPWTSKSGRPLPTIGLKGKSSKPGRVQAGRSEGRSKALLRLML